MDYIIIDGQLVPYESAAISPGDAGFLHGAGLFETMRVRNRRIFRGMDHLQRLATSAQTLGITLSLGLTQLNEMTQELLEAEDIVDARLRLTITRGDVYEAAESGEAAPPVTLVLSAQKFAGYPPQFYQTGVTVVASHYKQNPENPLTGHKTTSYLDRLVALREAQKLGAVEALWFTVGDNQLAEGSVSNVFIVDQGGALVTPPLTVPDKANQRLCLPGVARKTVLELAVEQQILPHERMLTIDDVMSAREAFVTNVVMGVMPVTKLEQHTIGAGQPGAITRGLMEAFTARVEKECAGS